jgi:hypothetical protein
MLAYKTQTKIDKQGNILISNLPFKNQELVEVIILIKDGFGQKLNINQRIDQLKASFGTIDSLIDLPDEVLFRENLYGDNGR